MDLQTRLFELVAPLRVGEELEGGARLIGASTELGLRLSFAVEAGEIHVEVTPADEARPHAARTPRLLFGYRSGGESGTVDPALGMALCQHVAKLAAPNEDAVLDRIAREAASAHTETEAGTRIREVRVDRLLEPSGFGNQRYFTLSPYVGCLIGCRFCYAQSRISIVRRLQLLPDVRWGSYVDVRVNAPEVLARELPGLEIRRVKFCRIVSDPYQALEKRWQLTRRCLEVIRDAANPPATLILTRSALIERDFDVIAAIPKIWVGASLPTIDDTARQHFEPRAASVSARLSMLRGAREHGIRTFAVVQPMLPGSIPDLADALANHVDSVVIDVLKGVEGAERDFAEPPWSEARDPSWQAARAAELEDLVKARGLPVWSGELPPELRDPP